MGLTFDANPLFELPSDERSLAKNVPEPLTHTCSLPA